ncbi:SusC/RagA family TonB-linked outer membrane protein [Hymenobacter guriensis]|uniref:SusC/RagA family TonB-linked outer membrane protein n=1 Tax=Hymenobacter guriensis TaxID=2793065 RepID=UPI0018CABFAE|nr:TonB-dependent receptor [Hymenobacter guriensis]
MGTFVTGYHSVQAKGYHSGAALRPVAASYLLQTNGTITGRVVDAKGEGLPGVNVLVRGTTNGTQTDANGGYALANVPSNATLVFSYVGFTAQELPLNGRAAVDVTLVEDVKALSEVVVVGYTTQKRTDVTGSVASISGTEIKSLPVTNVQEALQGRMAGVEVVKSSGAPDATASILIRGVSSLNNAPPLYIIDGVRQSGDNINIQDIASVDVLKDASAAAIYGSAAAGGVIVITTKKGKPGQPAINFSARYGVTQPRTLKLLNRDDFIRLKQAIADPVYVGMERTDTLPDTDWTKQIFRDGIEQNYNLSISGGTPQLSYLVSGIYNDQKGVYLNNRSALAGARVNTEYQLGKRIKVGEQLYVWQRRTKPVTITPINPPFRTVPTMSPYTNDPANPYGRNPVGFAGPNLIAQIGTAHIDNTKSNFQGNAFAEITLPLDLSFRTTFGYTYYLENQNYFQDSYNTGAVSAPINSLTKSSAIYSTLLNNYVLSYNHTFGAHAVSALVGFEQIQSEYDALRGSQNAVGGTSYAFLPTSNSITRITPGGYDTNGLIKSTFAQLNYGFNEKYLFSLSARRDGNFTVFGPGNQYGVFPAASAGWRISEEPLIKNALPMINQLKLRGSYGVLGNSNIPPYLFLSTYEYVNAQNFYPGAPPSLGYTQTLIPNPNIKWESVYESNVGIDAEAFNGRYFLTVEWYNKTTEDMLYALPIPLSVGIPSGRFYTNIGSVRNRGLDVVLGTKGTAHDFRYTATVTGSFNQNKVLNLDNINSNPIQAGDNSYGNPSYGQQTGQFLTYTKAGLPFGQFYGYQTEGIYQSQEQIEAHPQREGYKANIGDLIYRDVNGDGIISDQDKTILGNPNPKLTYGVNLNLGWKHFDLALLFNGVAGVDLYNGVAPYAQFPFSDGNTTYQVFGASFLGDNQLTSQPRLGVLTPGSNGAPATFATDPNGNYSYVSDYFVEKGNYVKLKNLQLGYTLGDALLQRAKIKSARLYVMANNLFTITNYSGIDPEIGGDVITRGIDAPLQYPHARIYSLGVDLTF